MYYVKITIIKKVLHEDLAKEYENPLLNPCPYEVGQTYLYDGTTKPEGLCESAWLSIYPYAFALSNGATRLHNNWLKNERQALVACNDGIRPVTFLLETVL